RYVRGRGRRAEERIQRPYVRADVVESGDVRLDASVDGRPLRAERLETIAVLYVRCPDREHVRRTRRLGHTARRRSRWVDARQEAVGDVAPVGQIVGDRGHPGADLDQDVPLLVEATWIRMRG